MCHLSNNNLRSICNLLYLLYVMFLFIQSFHDFLQFASKVSMTEITAISEIIVIGQKFRGIVFEVNFNCCLLRLCLQK